MMVIDETQVPDANLPVAALSRHLRLGRGFSSDDLQDGVLSAFLRAAISAIEGRIHKILLTRDLTFLVDTWDDNQRQTLSRAPVTQVISLTLTQANGTTTLADPESYRLLRDPARPALVATGSCLPAIPHNGTAEIRVTAGYGPSFVHVPADLGQAIMLLAAHYYEYRDETALTEGCMPFGVTSLLARYRNLSLGLTR